MADPRFLARYRSEIEARVVARGLSAADAHLAVSWRMVELTIAPMRPRGELVELAAPRGSR